MESGVCKPSVRACGNGLQCCRCLWHTFPSHTLSTVDLCHSDNGKPCSYLSTLSQRRYGRRIRWYIRLALGARLVCRAKNGVLHQCERWGTTLIETLIGSPHANDAEAMTSSGLCCCLS